MTRSNFLFRFRLQSENKTAPTPTLEASDARKRGSSGLKCVRERRDIRILSYVEKILDTCQSTPTAHFSAATVPRKLANYTTGGQILHNN